MPNIIDQMYLPFTLDQFKNHFAPVGNKTGEEVARKHVVEYIASAQRYRAFLAMTPDRRGLRHKLMQQPCQVEKDENFWTAACLMSYFYHPSAAATFAVLLQCAFPDGPPLADFLTWDACLTGDLHLFFRASLPSPPAYKRWLNANLENRHFIPYVRHAAQRPRRDEYRDDLEGATEADAVLLNATNGFAVLFEAKVCSDVSASVTYDLGRNQIARNIDVMLDSNSGLARPLSARRADRSLFVLLTPRFFRDHPHSRLYGWLMGAYCDPASQTLAHDLPHRVGQDWGAVKKRIGWLTWEDCKRVLPLACPWL